MEKHTEENQGMREIKIDLPDDIMDGVYSNICIIHLSPQEFILDFAILIPGAPKGRVKSRILIHPQNAKRLLAALNQNIANYEKAFGEIQTIDLHLGLKPTARA